jgi:hypothetical protein
MGETLKGILSMPDELFWREDTISRIQHNNARLEAVEVIEKLESEVQRLESLLEWIPVEERLPEEGKKVLVYRPNAYMSYDEEIRIVSRNENFTYRKNNNFFNCACKVTHWLTLPPLPEDL